MKKLNSTIVGIVAASWLAWLPARGEETTTSAQWSVAADSIQAAKADAEAAQAQVEKRWTEAGQVYRDALAKAKQTRLQFAQAAGSGSSEGGVSGGGGFGGSSGSSPPFSERLTRVISQATGSGGPGRSLVIRSGDGDPGAQSALEEDLAVMSHLLDKAIAEKVGSGNRERTAMGINVAFGPNADPIRNLYLDGYGAVFTLRVNFPLLPPPKVSEPPKEKAEATSDWDAARNELYGRDEGSLTIRDIPPRAMRLPPGGEPSEAYSEEKVTQLKDVLLDSLKSATNIRNLKSDDSITLCVFGGAGMSPMNSRMVSMIRVAPQPGTTETQGAGAPGPQPPPRAVKAPPWAAGYSFGPVGGAARGSILTIRVKKSDVEAFAKGRLDLDQFRKKAAIAIYPGGSDGGVIQ